MNIPYQKILTTLGTSLKYMRPAATQMAIGAGIGAATGYLGGNGNTLRDAGIGALGGLAYGRGYHKVFNTAASAEKGMYNMPSGFNAVKSRMGADMSYSKAWAQDKSVGYKWA